MPSKPLPVSGSPASASLLGRTRPVWAGTQCGATAAFPGHVVAPALPSPNSRVTPPTSSTRAASFALTIVSASPDGQLLGVAGSTGGSDTAQLWAVGGSKPAILAGGAGAVSCLAWSPDSSLLASAYRNGDVRLWDRHGQVVRTLRGGDPVLSLAWSPDGETLATGAVHFPTPGQNGLQPLPGVITFWTRGGSLERTVTTQFTGGKFLNLAWSPDGSVLAAGAVDYGAWRPDGSVVGVPRTGGTPAWAMAWSPDGRAIAIGDENGTLQIVAPDGTTRSVANFDGGINSITYSPDGTAVAIGHGSSVSVVKTADGRTILWSAAAASAYAVWSEDGSALLISRGDGLALIGPDGVPSSTLTGCSGYIDAFTWDGPVVVAATDSGWLCSWRSPGRVLMPSYGPYNSAEE
jgi:WD40 repeat protein